MHASAEKYLLVNFDENAGSDEDGETTRDEMIEDDATLEVVEKLATTIASIAAAAAGDDEDAAAAKMEGAKAAVPLLLLPAAATRLTRRLERNMINLMFDIYCVGVLIGRCRWWRQSGLVWDFGLRIHHRRASRFGFGFGRLDLDLDLDLVG